MTLTVEPVRTPSELAEFIALPARLYAGMPGYVAPLDRERREILDPRRSPFFSHGVASYWIARRDGRVVGRISAQIDHLADPGSGYFGCLDCADDEAAVSALLRAAEAWLKERNRSLVQGPFMLSINGESGILVDGHGEQPMVMMPWHPPYLDRHIKNAGYATCKELYSLVLDPLLPSERLRRLGVDRSRPEFVVRGLRMNDLNADAAIGQRLFNDAWQDNWGFVPVAEMEVRAAIREFRMFLVPESGVFIEHRGKPVAFGLALPNLFDITADLGHAPSPLGWLKFAWRAWRQPYRSWRVALFGVSSELRNTVLGGRIAMTISDVLIRNAFARGARVLEAGWLLEDNQAVQSLTTMGFKRARTYRLYQRAL